MLTLPSLMGLLWVVASFVCLIITPFAILAYMVKNRYNLFEIIIVQILSWLLIFAFVHLIFGGFWFFIGIIGPAATMG